MEIIHRLYSSGGAGFQSTIKSPFISSSYHLSKRIQDFIQRKMEIYDAKSDKAARLIFNQLLIEYFYKLDPI